MVLGPWRQGPRLNAAVGFLSWFAFVGLPPILGCPTLDKTDSFDGAIAGCGSPDGSTVGHDGVHLASSSFSMCRKQLGTHSPSSRAASLLGSATYKQCSSMYTTAPSHPLGF